VKEEQMSGIGRMDGLLLQKTYSGKTSYYSHENTI